MTPDRLRNSVPVRQAIHDVLGWLPAHAVIHGWITDGAEDMDGNPVRLRVFRFGRTGRWRTSVQDAREFLNRIMILGNTDGPKPVMAGAAGE